MKIGYVSWADNTGYAIAAKSYLGAFQRAGMSVSWEPMLPGPDLYERATDYRPDDPVLAGLIDPLADYDTMVIHTVPEYYPPLIAEARRGGKRVFGYTVWEHERLPDHWPAILNRLDGVIVPCTWNVDVFRRSGVFAPIHVVPHLSQFSQGIDRPTPPEASDWLPPEAASPDRFMFYTIGHWSARKAPHLVIEAYLRAFGAGDPVSLLVKTSRNDVTRWQRHWRNGFRRRHPSPLRAVSRMLKGRGRMAPLIVLPDEERTDTEMLALHQRGDCYVSLTRTEGWGLGAFDAALSATPVIMTGYGGQRDFLDPDLAQLVDYRLVPVQEPLWHHNYRPTDQWAEPDIEQAATMMRSVFEHREDAAERARKLRERLRVRFSEAEIIAAWNRALAG